MNIRIKRAMIAAGIATTMALPMSGQASDGTISFTGAVTASTCTLKVNGGNANGSVALPTVDSSALTNAASKINAAGTFFNIALSNCNAVADIGAGPSAPTQVQIYFEAGPNVDPLTGGLINTTVGGSNVEVALFNASGPGNIVNGQIQPGTNTNQPQFQAIGNSTQWFYAGYSTLGAAGVATAGAVTTSVTYSLVYQ